MRTLRGIAVLFVASLLGAAMVVAVEGPPPWAYGFDGPAPPAGSEPANAGRGGRGGPGGGAGGAGRDAPAAAPDTTLQHIPGSTLGFTAAQIRNGFGPADWFPEDHPPMPEIVAKGKMPEVNACALCHYPNGKGRPENAPIAGLPYSYIVQTLTDFRNGNRKSADSRKANTGRMSGFAKSMSDAEIADTAKYFSSMKWTPWIRVVESSTAPKTHINAGMFVKNEGNETEALGERIIEVPENSELTEQFRDPHSGFVAYVPNGSIKRGEELVVRGGAGKTTACGVCHGANLEGVGPVPPLAGRSPSYLVRQLYDMQQGTRTGIWTELMKPVVSKLTNADMLAIAAYVSSRPVAGATEQGTSGR